MNAADLDPGIRAVVLRLRSAGFETTDSGDGVSKPVDERVFEVPHVACRAVADSLLGFFGEARRLLRVLGPPWRVEASYCPNDDSALLLATKTEESNG